MNPKLNRELEDLCINTIRILSADAVQNANAGHPGMPMGAAAMAFTLWTQFLKHNPGIPQWVRPRSLCLVAGQAGRPPRQQDYSKRKASIAFSRLARRAGSQTASTATEDRTIGAIINAAGSQAWTPNRNPARPRARPSAAHRPRAIPIIANRMPCATTIFSTSPVPAPKATRIPISCVLCCTE